MDGEGANLIKEAKAGIACEASNSNALSDGVLQLYNMTQSERDSMGQRGRDYFFKHFSKEKLLDQFEKMIGDCT